MDSTYIVYLTNGERGAWHTDSVRAGSSEEAREKADNLRPGWRCYGVQLRLEDEQCLSQPVGGL